MAGREVLATGFRRSRGMMGSGPLGGSGDLDDVSSCSSSSSAMDGIRNTLRMAEHKVVCLARAASLVKYASLHDSQRVYFMMEQLVADHRSECTDCASQPSIYAPLYRATHTIGRPRKHTRMRKFSGARWNKVWNLMAEVNSRWHLITITAKCSPD